MRVNDVSCNCPEYGGQVRHNTGCPLGGWHPSQTMGTTTRPMPRTEAGERLLDNSAGRTHMKDTARYEDTAALIAAIQAEAIAAERERIRDAVEGLEEADIEGVWTANERKGATLGLFAVLRIIDREDTDERCPVHTFIALRDCDVHGPKAYRDAE